MKLAALPFDFAPRAGRGTPLAHAMVLGLAAILAWQGFNLVGAYAARQREAETLTRLAAPPRPVALAPAGRIDPADAARLRSARQIAQTLATPWSDLIASLEEAPQDAVALIAVEPSVAKQTLRLTAEARDPKAMLVYLAALQADRRLSGVMLVSHQVQVQAPGTPVRFRVQATWATRS